MSESEQLEVFRECKKSASSYISRQKFVKDSERRLDVIRDMIVKMEHQLIVLKNAEAALAAQVDKFSAKSTTERKKYNGRKK